MTDRTSRAWAGIVAMLGGVLLAEPAWAHHLMGGRMPATFAEGLLSGLGHPVIGIDHLACLIALAVVVAIASLNLLIPVAFVAASAVGVALHVHGADIPGAELFVAGSVVVVGLLVARGSALPLSAWTALFAVTGLFHGYAYGESIYGAETTPLAAYLLGLTVVQSALAIGVASLIRRASAAALAPRLAGAAVAGIGLAVLAQQIVPAA
jgi:urease accessory protein